MINVHIYVRQNKFNNMNKKLNVIICIVIVCIFPLMVNAQKKLTIYGEVFDKVTHVGAFESVVFLTKPDSSIIDSAKVGGADYFRGKIIRRLSSFHFNADVPGKYLLKVTCKGYETLYIPLDLSKVYRREYGRNLPDIFIRRAHEQILDEVKVVATKIKFYNKGDTLVYNADAFQLSEGSMLDALVRQLPGAELKDDGRIYVNGKFVESLMLNGKDFFKGKNEVLLDNLPTYMVKNIKVYNKSSELSKWLGRDVEKKSLVMDVSLKKEYNTGWVANMEAGGGSSDRFLSRLFALRFTDHSRLSAFANMNNTNDSRKPGQNTEWTPEKMPHGMMTTRMGGLDYNFEPRNSPVKINGNAQLQHTDNNVVNTTNRTNFFTGGDTYDRIVNTSRACDTKVSTQHYFQYQQKKFSFEERPQFEYHKYRDKGDDLSATSSEELSTLGKDFLDSLFTPVITSMLQKELLNRNIQKYKRNGSEWNFTNYTYSRIRVPHTNDMFFFNTTQKFEGANNNNFLINRIDYPSGTGAVDYRNDYSKGVQGRGYYYDFSPGYNYYVKKGLTLTFGYTYGQEYTFKSRSLYRLDRLEGWGASSNEPLGALPSMIEYENVIDASNSYRSRLLDRTNKARLSLFWSHTDKKSNYCSVDFYFNLPFHHQKMTYERGIVDTTITRNRTSVESYTNVILNSGDGKRDMEFGYSLFSSLPDLAYAANVIDDSNPLSVTHGNGHLKTTHKYNLYANYTYRSPEKQLSITPLVQFNYYQNSLAMGYVYNRTTGRRDITPDNVNGNYDLMFKLKTMMPVDKKKSLMFNNDIGLTLYHSVDLTGIVGAASALRSTVMTRNISEEFTLEKTFGQQKLSLKGTFVNIHSTGSLDNFETINAYNYSYGLMGTFRLPWKIDLSTDVTMYSRRGYEDDAMNKDDLLWNARISRPLFKGKIVLLVDAFDILHKLSNVQRYMNAQARTETYVNTLPRYVMFHCIYRFNFMPKKKKR
jgi:hypothetical protein